MPAGRRDMFPPDRGLQLRVALALAGCAVVGAALVAVLTAAFVAEVYLGLILLSMLMVTSCMGAQAVRSLRLLEEGARVPTREDRARVQSTVERLCMLGDVKAPSVWVEGVRAPLIWTETPSWRGPRVRIATGLLDVLPDDELSAVLAHEVAHVAHGDARVTGLLSKPGVYVIRGLATMWTSTRGPERLCLLLLGPFLFGPFVPPAAILSILARIVTRHREYSADRSAAALIGAPTTLATALRRLAGRLAELPEADLRIATVRDPLNILPARPETGVRRLWATHPRLEDRLDQLERLERGMQVPVA